MEGDRELFADLPVLEGVVVTDKELGRGSYGIVLEVQVGQVLCAAKEIHEYLLDGQDPGLPTFKKKYADECRTLSRLQHPRIVQFMGIYFKPESKLPLMVMELLLTSLGKFLDDIRDIDLSLKLCILQDVCTGLDYLHNQNIVHRDLSHNNVLLDSSLRAKITDMGNSRIFNRPKLPHTMTLAPGTPMYMPPEALGANPRYGPSLDIFSFGHLSLYTLTQVCPDELLPSSYFNEETEITAARTQIECRKEYIDHLKELYCRNHEGIVQMVSDCLEDSYKKRPSCRDLLTRLEGLTGCVNSVQGCLRPVIVGRVLMEMQLRNKDREIEALKLSNDNTLKRLKQQEVEWKKKLELEQDKLKEWQKKYEESEKEREVIHSNKKEVIHMPLEESWQGPLNIAWQDGHAMPFATTDYIQSVIIGGALYVGGGWTRKRSDNNYLVLRFDLSSRVWRQIPVAYFARDFAMVTIEEQLVLVGGCDRTNVDTNLLGMLNADKQEWVRPYPPMATARHNSSAAYHDGYLVVAGGMNLRLLSTVEILDVKENQWHGARGTPTPCHSMKSAIVGEMWYLMGGYETSGTSKAPASATYCVSLSKLCAIATKSQVTSDEVWRKLPGAGCLFASPVTIDGSLYAIGGKCSNAGIATLSRYSESAGWQIAGKLQSPVYNCTCSYVNQVLYIAGGTCDAASPKLFIGSLN